MVVLPSSFTGGPRYMHERTQDAMTYVRHFGRPDLFITFTCNPKWSEIEDLLRQGQKYYDRHDIIARVFCLKVKHMMNLLTKGCIFGNVRCNMYTVEWQKRGLPHVHILLWLEEKIRLDSIDEVIRAELPDPDQDQTLHEIIKSTMIHGPCGVFNFSSPCMLAGVCTKRYPRPFLKETQTGEDGYPKYRRRSPEDGGIEIKINGNDIDNRWVVPFNPVLSRTFKAHINVEYCNSVKSIRYICKYVNKGSDQAAFTVENLDEVSRRKKGKVVTGFPEIKKDHVLGRVYTVHPGNAECIYLRLLLHEIRGPTSFNDLKTVEGVEHPTFQATCRVLGLLEDDINWDRTLEEASIFDSPYKIRELFAIMLVFCQVGDPIKLWTKYRESLAEDIKRQMERESRDVELIVDIVYNQCLILLENIITSMSGKSLLEFGLPEPLREQSNVINNRQYINELAYDVSQLIEAVSVGVSKLNDDQKQVYDEVLNSIDSNSGKLFFLDAPGGTGKTFLINLLLAKIRSRKNIAVAVASSGIAATLIYGGKTAHSAFKLPLNLNYSDNPICNISKQSDMAHVLRETKIIGWDECTMAHKKGIEALNQTLQDIRENNRLMGGLTILLAGDFRQTLPVVRRGTRADEIKACLKSSILWPNIKVLSLKVNMRVCLQNDLRAKEFSELLIDIGNGNLPKEERKITIPSNLCETVGELITLIDRIYPNIQRDALDSLSWLKERAILTPINESADRINTLLIEQQTTEHMKYESVDTVIEVEETVYYPVEFLHTLNPPGIPPHIHHLKIGTPIMLLRNLNPPKLCNGTRLQVKTLRKNLIEATIFAGKYEGENVFIPRIPLIPSDYHFKFKRLQFPVRVCFAMTINKAQGQSLKLAGVELQSDCFSHGQFYLACSRVSSSENLIILQPEKRTKNVVYKEVLNM
ncbi:uncharacterized protein LOC141526552 [Cotesia typhae]|uniref:uncharacterized protein LOC141526552 n=1 Tax=Cotesia typhae TaxID=2053667 RepID=UPI003D69581F